MRKSPPGHRLVVGQMNRSSGVSTDSAALSNAAVRASATFDTEDGRVSPVYGVGEKPPGLFAKRNSTGRLRYHTEELAPGIRLQVAEGIEAGFVNVGTLDTPVWIVSPGKRVGVLQETVETGAVVHDYAGFLPLLLMAAKPAARAVRRYLRDNDAGDNDGDDDEASGLSSAFANPQSGGTSNTRFVDASGAILTDTDGKRVLA